MTKRRRSKGGQFQESHGHSYDHGTRTYQTWCRMRQRCLNPNHENFKYYGGANPPVTICKRWQNSFEAFVEDMGARPKGTSLGRILDSSCYCKSNREWQTKLQQGVERRGKNAAKLLHGLHARQRRKAA